MKTDNELIAEFMGGKDAEDVGNPYEYHIWWDCLMPVIERIQNLEDSFSVSMGYGSISNLGIQSHYAYCHIENWKGEEVIGHSGMPTLIECVYLSVVGLIKWRNAQNPELLNH
jgi:hypothetical protein